MKNIYLIIVLLFASSFYACKKDAELSSPEVKLAIEGELVTGKVNEVMAFSASTKNGKGFSHEWKLDDKVVSNSYGYNFTPLLAGSYVLAYNAWNDAGSFTHKYTITVPVPVKGATRRVVNLSVPYLIISLHQDNLSTKVWVNRKVRKNLSGIQIVW